MALDSDLVGRSLPPTPPYLVSEEKVREFAAATGSDFDGRHAPVTFPIVVAFGAMTRLMQDPEVGISLRHVVHGDQRLSYTRPVHVGDRLVATLTVDSLRQPGGADIIGTRTDISTDDGEPVCVARATLVHRVPTPDEAGVG